MISNRMLKLDNLTPRLEINVIMWVLIPLLNSPAYFWIHEHFKFEKKCPLDPRRFSVFLMISWRCLLAWTLTQRG